MPALGSGGGSGGSSFFPVETEPLVAQPHGGALKPGGTLEGSSKGGRVAAERRRARMERNEAIDDAMLGHVEKMSEIIGQLVEDAGGEQYRCACGLFGPKVPKLGLKETADVQRLLMQAVKETVEAATVIPIQVNVVAGGPVVPYRPDEG